MSVFFFRHTGISVASVSSVVEVVGAYEMGVIGIGTNTVYLGRDGSAVALTNSRVTASGLTFQNLSRASTPGIIRVQFTFTHVNPDGRNEYSFTKTFIGSATLRQP